MLGYLLIWLVITYDLLLPFHCHLHGEAASCAVFHQICTRQREFFRTMTEIETVRSSESALGHGKIMYRIKQIGLSLTIVAADAVDVRGKLYLLKRDVPEIGNDYFL